MEALQDDVPQVFTTGKRVKVESMHLTVATLTLKEKEVQRTDDQLKEVTQKFINLVGPTHWLTVIFEGIGWVDNGVLWAEAFLPVDSI